MKQATLLVCSTLLSVINAGYLGDYTPHHPRADNSTFGNTDEIHTTHLHLSVVADFDNKVLQGYVTHDLEVVADRTQYFTVDIWDLDIDSVYLLNENSAMDERHGKDVSNDPKQTLQWSIMSPTPALGDVLIIDLAKYYYAGNNLSVQIKYTTSPTGNAFSWLNPEQTAGGLSPYLFTQCEDINCRSVLPVQDTPSNRITYSAYVVAPKELVAKMSANETLVESYNDTYNVARFECMIPIPNYLMALAIGDIEYRSLGRRVGVITEPSEMEKCANELDTLEELLDETEKYMGPYIWGNYTILVLPPSFPMGGMENPLLTFASPTIIVGDKSQVYVATHEIAHSWTGNQVTCQNWENFWLNEGFTVFVERKVSGKLHGYDFAQVEAQLGNSSLWSDIQYYSQFNPTYASIHPVLQGDNPDNSFSDVPYEKGFQFLYYIQNVIGDDAMQTFLNYWIVERSLTSVTTIDLRQTWEQWVGDNYPVDEVNVLLAQIDWEEWMYVGSLAPVALNFTTSEAEESAALALAYIALGGDGTPPNYEDYFTFYSNLKVIFHETLQNNIEQVDIAILTKVDADLNVTADPDPEVKQRWLPLGLTLNYDPVYEPAHTWVSEQGRAKYLDSVYQALQASGQHDLGVTWYEENVDFYHPIAATDVRRDLELPDPTTPEVMAAKAQAMVVKKMLSWA